MIKIRKITAFETFPVRHPVPRSGKPINSCHFNGDVLATTIHFGLYHIDNLVGVVSLFKVNNELFEQDNQYQIRGMAVLIEHQKKGFGEFLIINAEEYCNENNVNLIWFNARKEAIGFYQKMGYKREGISFEIKDVGEHVVMFKNLK